MVGFSSSWLLAAAVVFNRALGSAVPHSLLSESLSTRVSSRASNSPGNGGVPDTGSIRRYEFEVTRGNFNPDGVEKTTAMLINGQIPGPTIEANYGDWISVTVTNKLTDPSDEEGLTLHYHGMQQRKTPWFDGVPGVSQCPIAPGKTYTYLFQADQYGTSWYHSHYGSQYSDGVFGPMVIHGPPQPGVHYDEDLGTFSFFDYNQADSKIIVDDSFEMPPVFINIDNNLLNGVGCSLVNGACDWDASYSRLPSYRFETGKTYLLRFINPGVYSTQKITIDNHKMTIIANDYVPIQPFETEVITLGIGQRTDVLITATGKSTDAVFLRSDLDLVSANDTATNTEARAIILYQDTPKNTVPTSTATPWSSNGAAPDPLSQSVPAYPSALPSAPGQTQELTISFIVNSTGYALFTVNNATFKADYNEPIIGNAQAGKTSFPTDWNVYPVSGSTSRLIINNEAPFVHPMHLHGHNFWVLAQGFGTWDGSIANAQNPTRRDTQIMPPGSPANPSYLVIEWELDNPGIWPLHCHLPIHISYGLMVNFLEQPSELQKDREIPGVLEEACRDWDQFSSHYVVDEIDSGV